MFEIDKNVKDEFLNGMTTGTAAYSRLILKAVDEYEVFAGKKVYDLSTGEIKTFFVQKFDNASVGAIQKNASVVRTYIDYCIGLGIVDHGENRLAMLNKDDFKSLVSLGAIRNKYITKEELRECQRMLINEQDICILELFFNGIRGRTASGATYEEILNLTISDVDERNNTIKLTKNDGSFRIIPASTKTIAIIVSAWAQEEYIIANGTMEEGATEILIKPGENILRKPGAFTKDPFNESMIRLRFSKMQKWLGNKHLTASNLYMSGIMDRMAKAHNSGEPVNDELIAKICAEYDYGGGNYKRYLWTIKDNFELYLRARER